MRLLTSNDCHRDWDGVKTKSTPSLLTKDLCWSLTKVMHGLVKGLIPEIAKNQHNILWTIFSENS